MKKWIRYTAYTLKRWFLFKIWAVTNNDLKRQFIEDEFHQKLMNDSVQTISKRFATKEQEYTSTFVGVIPHNWEELIDAKIKEKEKQQ